MFPTEILPIINCLYNNQKQSLQWSLEHLLMEIDWYVEPKSSGVKQFKYWKKWKSVLEIH